LFYVFFFFSSRRRHTRWPRDWSSDVCSSDLGKFLFVLLLLHTEQVPPFALIQVPGPDQCDDSDEPEPLPSGTSSVGTGHDEHPSDRKSTRLNSSHVAISYAVFCLKKKKQTNN